MPETLHLTDADAQIILKAFDDSFNRLLNLQQWKHTLSTSEPLPSKQYIVVFECSDKCSSNAFSTRRLSIIIGPRPSVDALGSVLEQTTSRISNPLELLKVDHSQNDVHFSYAIVSYAPGTNPSLRSLHSSLSAQDRAHVELRLAADLKSVNGIENDWFGLPGDPDEWKECYSWQECFSLLLETALMEAESQSVNLPYEDIRRALGRAIAFFLFDDVEVPNLVWNTSLDWDEDVELEMDEAHRGVESMAALALTGALWGDPLMEGAFFAPSDTFIEGYGGSPIVFARQRTKRTWYTLYVALRTLLAEGHRVASQKYEENLKSNRISQEELRNILTETIEQLKYSPCY